MCCTILPFWASTGGRGGAFHCDCQLLVGTPIYGVSLSSNGVNSNRFDRNKNYHSILTHLETSFRPLSFCPSLPDPTHPSQLHNSPKRNHQHCCPEHRDTDIEMLADTCGHSAFLEASVRSFLHGVSSRYDLLTLNNCFWSLSIK